MMANAIDFTEFNEHPISLDTILGLVLCSSLAASDIP